jgi:hypothetical protein
MRLKSARYSGSEAAEAALCAQAVPTAGDKHKKTATAVAILRNALLTTAPHFAAIVAHLAVA